MNVNKIFGAGILGCLAAVGAVSCKKEYKPITNPAQATVTQLKTYNDEARYILQDTTYHFFGNDTIELDKTFFTNPTGFLEKLNKLSQKATPKKKVGSHTEVRLIPKSGGGFMHIPTVKSDYAPIYKDQIGVIKSKNLYTTNGEDIYIPIEFYGKINL